MLIPWRQRFTSESGLTLIELLVVCVVIVILSLLAMPIYAGANDRARQARSADELRVISEAVEAYNAEVGHYPANLSLLRDRGLLKNSMSMQTPWSTADNPIYYFYAVDRGIARAYAVGDPGPDADCENIHALRQEPPSAADREAYWRPVPCGRDPTVQAYTFGGNTPSLQLEDWHGTSIAGRPSMVGFRSDLRTER